MNLEPARKRQKRLKKAAHNGKRIDFVLNLFSKELALKVLSYLSSADLVQCAAVSSHWARLANDEMLWKPLFYCRFRDSITSSEQGLHLTDNKRRASVTRYGGSWKAKYRVHENWLSGNCYVDNIPAGNDTKLYSNSRQLLQIVKDLVFIVSENYNAIDVWKYIENDSKLLYRIESTALKAYNITFMKLIEGNPHQLIAGYTNGGFALWEINYYFGDLNIKEIANYSPYFSEDNSVISIGICFPMILLCTKNMELSAIYIDETNSVKLIHKLQSSVDWNPVNIDIHAYNNNLLLWKAIICFGLSMGNHASSVGLQEIILSPTSIKSSQHVTALESEPFFFSSSMSYYSRHNNNNDTCDNSLITSMVYSPPYLITAHPNNTIKQYIVSIKDHKLAVYFKKTLYGHTFRVEALAMEKEKLLSADRSGIKVWNLLKNNDMETVTININRNQSCLQDLPFQHIKSLCFDEDRIVAFMNDEVKSCVRLWSFDSMQ